MIRNVILDWSGTLVDDLPAVLEATNHVLREAGLEPFSRERFRAEFRLPFTSFYERYTPEVPMARLEEWFHARFREVQHTVAELPHARAFLEFCRERGLRTFLLSTMHPDHFAEQTRVNRFDQFLDHAYLGIWDKRQKIRELLEVHRLSPEETVFVGDMEHDVETARHGGIHSVAVLTGYNDSEQLRRAGPDLIVEHLGEFQAILAAHALDLGRALTDRKDGGVGNRLPVVTVGAAILNGGNQVLLVRTHKWSGKWGIPGGKVKYGEASVAALERELREETGLPVRDVEFVMVQDCIGSREFYREEHFILLNYRCRASGDDPVRLNEEAQDYRWMPIAEAMTMDLNVPTRVLLETIGGTRGAAA